MVEQLHKPNVYHIKSINGDSPEHVVNCRQLQDLQEAHNDSNSEEEMGNIPSFNPRTHLKDIPHSHKYATQEKG